MLRGVVPLKIKESAFQCSLTQVRVDHKELIRFGIAVLRASGCDEETAKEVAFMHPLNLV